jgi:hypothetical protein
MFSVQGYARLDELFTTFRSERLAQEEKEREESQLDSQLPSEDDIEREFLEIVSKGLETLKARAAPSFTGYSCSFTGYSCIWCDGSHLGIDCEHRGYRAEIAP